MFIQSVTHSSDFIFVITVAVQYVNQIKFVLKGGQAKVIHMLINSMREFMLPL